MFERLFYFRPFLKTGACMDLFITGGTGFIGTALCQSLQQRGDHLTVMARDPDAAQKHLGRGVDIAATPGFMKQKTPDAVINLAGLPIADRRWSKARKAELRASRVELTHRLVDTLECVRVKPKVLISASAVGYYGNQGNRLVDEYTVPREEFTHSLCLDWEKAALRAENLGMRVCILRIGLVVGANGGFLQRMLIPFRLGLGGRLGTGQQWMSWIYQGDLQRMITYLLDHETLQGIFNATAPNPVRNAEFTDVLARQLNRPARMPVPAPMLQASMGEMSRLLLTGQRVVPSRLLEAGFEFKHERLDSALRAVLA